MHRPAPAAVAWAPAPPSLTLKDCAADSRATSGLTSAVAQSATTLAEDVRQLAEWCRTAEAARDATDARIEQLEHAPVVQKQLEQLQDEVGHAALCRAAEASWC